MTPSEIISAWENVELPTGGRKPQPKHEMDEATIEARHPDRCRHRSCWAPQQSQDDDPHRLHLCARHTRQAHGILAQAFIRKARQFDHEKDRKRA